MPLSSSVILAHAVDRGADRRLQAAKNLPGKKPASNLATEMPIIYKEHHC